MVQSDTSILSPVAGSSYVLIRQCQVCAYILLRTNTSIYPSSLHRRSNLLSFWPLNRLSYYYHDRIAPDRTISNDLHTALSDNSHNLNLPQALKMLYAMARRNEDDAWSGFKLWHYSPSVAAAAIFTILFVLLTAYHAFLLVRRRTWFCIPFVVGGILEVLGYIARALAHNNTDSVGLYTMQSLCLLLPPILFAASVYMILGRIIRVTQAEHHSLIRVNWLTKIFVGGDVFCFMTQGAGGGLLATADTTDAVDTYNNIILGGLILQILIFLVFIVTGFIFQRRLSNQPTAASLDGPLGVSTGGVRSMLGRLTWKRLMLGLYLTSVLITIRNLFRVIEYGMGWNSYLLDHEWSLYVFDGLLMVLLLATCIMWYDPEIAKGNKKLAARRPMNLTTYNEADVQHETQLVKGQSAHSQAWS